MYDKCEIIICEDDPNYCTVKGPCFLTGKIHETPRLLFVDVLRYQRREALIQNIFPHLNRDEREFLINGCSPEGWKQTFKDE